MAPNRLRTPKRPWHLLQRQRRSRRWCRSRGRGSQRQSTNFLTDTSSKGSAVVEQLEQPFIWCNVKLGMAGCRKPSKARSSSCFWYHGQIRKLFIIYQQPGSPTSILKLPCVVQSIEIAYHPLCLMRLHTCRLSSRRWNSNLHMEPASFSDQTRSQRSNGKTLVSLTCFIISDRNNGFASFFAWIPD